MLPLGHPLLEEVPEEDPMQDRRRRCRALATAGVVIALLVAAVIFHSAVNHALEAFIHWCRRLGWGAPVLVAVAVVALQLLMLPTFPMMVGAGIIFPHMFGPATGQVIGVSAVFAGIWAGSMVSFFLGRAAFKEWAEAELMKFAWMQVINSMVEEQGWRVVLLARASPVLPLELFNYACSLTSLTPMSYAVGCLGSIIPCAVWVCSSASAATAIKDANSDSSSPERVRQHMLFLVANAAFLFILTLMLGLAVKRYQEKIYQHVERQMTFCDDLPEEQDRKRKQLKRQISRQTLMMRRDTGSLRSTVHLRKMQSF